MFNSVDVIFINMILYFFQRFLTIVRLSKPKNVRKWLERHGVLLFSRTWKSGVLRVANLSQCRSYRVR